MYEFKGLQGTTDAEGVRLRSDELYLDGKTLTGQIEGYTQVSVTDGLLQGYEVETVKYLNRYGEEPIGVRKGVREFTIKYVIYSTSRSELRERFDKLQRLLNGEHVVSFADLGGWYYQKVVLTGVGSVETNSLNIVSTFTLTAYDPHRYAPTLTKEETVSINSVEKVDIEGIEVTFSATIDNPLVVIDNGLYTTDFRLAGTVNAGTVFRITINRNNGMIATSGASLVLGTLPRRLVVYNGTTGYVDGHTQDATVTFEYREVVV